MKYYPHTPGDIEKMLESIGVDSVDSLFSDIPREKLISGLNLQPPLAESEVLRQMNRMATRNRSYYDRPSFLGAGCYRHFSPSVIDALISRSEFYTAYTPYQAEASQGMLQSIFEYQSLICRLTGMDVSNASVYDGATACAEAVTLCSAHTGKRDMLYSAGLHPEYVQTIKTYFRHSADVNLVEIPVKDGVTCLETLKKSAGGETAGLIIQNPNCLGFIEPAIETGRILKEINSKAVYVIAVTEPHSLGLLKNPGDCGADIAAGEGGGLGIPPSYGGPSLGFLAVKTPLMRKIPGRLVGQTVDAKGKRAFCLTLQAREQHIRREKATSNICTNQALCALAATIYLSYTGKQGFLDVARLNLEKAHYLKEKLTGIRGIQLFADRHFFNEFTVKCPDDPVKIDLYLRQRGITGGFITGKWRNEWKGCMTFCATELNARKDIDDVTGYLENYCREEASATCTTA